MIKVVLLSKFSSGAMTRRNDGSLNSAWTQAAQIPPNSKAKETTLSILNNAIETLQLVKDLVPFELAKGVLSSVASILTRVKSIIQNQDDFVELAEQCNRIGVVIWRTISGKPESEISPTIRDAIADLQSSVNIIQNAIHDKTKSRLDFQVLHVTLNRETIAAWQHDLDRFLIMFNTELNLSSNMTIDVVNAKLDDLIVMFEDFRNTTNPKTNILLSDPLPAVPPIFLGRDPIVKETVDFLLKCRHVALIGPGGMGKSYVARKVLHDDTIFAKYQDRRFFVRYDDIDASQVTHETFLNRIAKALGIRTSKTNLHGLICKSISSHETLLVLDNAETFLDAALDAGRIAESIDDIGALANVTIMMTTRTTVLPYNLDWARLRVPALEESPACQLFKRIYPPAISPIILTKLLSALDFHPLSINLLAQAALQNEWSPEELVKRWEAQHSTLLENGTGRIQSLAVTIELSFNSPSLKNLGDTVRGLYQVIAFLPQGINATLLLDMFSGVPNIQSTADMLCKHSLAYRKGDFITMLAPIRLYVSTTYNRASTSIIPLLRTVQDYYTRQLASEPVDTAWVNTEDINIEHVVALTLTQCDTKSMRDACLSCESFIQCLTFSKCRPTSLRPVILALQPDVRHTSFTFSISRRRRKKENLFAKGLCLRSLNTLALNLGHTTEAMELLLEAKSIFLECGSLGLEALIRCELAISELYGELGNFIAAEEACESALKRAPQLPSSKYCEQEASINEYLGTTRIFRGRLEGVDLLFKALKFYKSEDNGLDIAIIESQIGHANLFSGKFTEARLHFEAALSFFTQNGLDSIRIATLDSLLDVAHREGDEVQRNALLDQLRDTTQRSLSTDDRVRVLSTISAHTALRGNVEEARAEINRAIVEADATGLDLTLAKAVYIAAFIELLADNRQKASELFHRVISLCETLPEMLFRARAERALGEVALLEKNHAAAHVWFTKASVRCQTMGILLEALYYCESCFILSDDFEGWSLFQDGRLPSSDKSESRV